MNKFLILFKKEAQSFLNVQNILPVVLIFVMFYLLGSIMGGLISDDEIIIDNESTAEAALAETDGSNYNNNTFSVSKNSIVGFIDNDNSEYSNIIKDSLSSMGILALPESKDPEEAMRELENYNFHGEEIKVGSLIVINPGFETSLKAGKYTAVDVYSALDSFGLTSMISGIGGYSAAGMINGIISSQLLSSANITEDIYFLTNPVYPSEYTYLNEKTQNVNASAVLSYVTSQLTFVPIIIMVIILMASTTLATSMVNEKADKTLETLMTTPIGRMSVLLSKILSAAIYAAIYAVVFVIAFQRFNSSMSLDGALPDGLLAALENFGINFDVMTFLIIGSQLFLSVLCGLAIAIIIGMMVDDIKALQSYIMPLMMVIMIPYFLTMFLDVNTLPLIGRILVYIIPFSHSFTAAANLFTQNYALLIGGIIYQSVFVAVMLTIAVRIFNSDKLFTLGQSMKKKPKAKKVSAK